MAQKINPLSLRLQQTNRHFDSCWYSAFSYTKLLTQDLQMQQYLNSILKQIQYPSARYIVHNQPKKSKICVFFCNPKMSRLKRTQRFHLHYRKKKVRTKQSFAATKYYFLKNNIVLKNHYFNYLSEFSAKNLTDKLGKNIYFPKKNQTLENRNSLLKMCYINKNLVENKKNYVFNYKHNLNFISLFSKDLDNCFTNGKYAKISMFNCEQELNNKTNIYTTSGISLFTHKKQFFFRFICAIFFLLKQQNPLLLLHYVTLFQNLSGLNDLSTALYINKKYKQLPFSQKVSANQFTKQNKVFLSQELFDFTLQSHLEPTQLNSTTNKLMAKRGINQPSNEKYCALKKHNDFSLVSEKQTNITSIFSKKKHASAFAKMTKFLSSNTYVRGNKKKFLNFYHNKKQNSTIIYKKSYKEHLQVLLSKQLQRLINVQFFRAFNDLQNALFLAQEIIYYLERRVSFRQIKNQILKEIKKKTHIQGIRITCSGRVGGRSKKAQRSKTETFKYGQTCLHVFSSKIDFACKSARTAFGLIGVKVWICFK